MFDKLVESTQQNKGKGAGRYFAITSALYFLVLLALCIGTVLTFSPVLAEENALLAVLAPPTPQGNPPELARPQKMNRSAQPEPDFVAPRKPVDTIPLPDEVTPRIVPIVPGSNSVAGAPNKVGTRDGVPGVRSIDENTPPPPTPRPTLVPPPTPTPTPERKQTQPVSEGVLQGRAIHKVKPAYPQIARSIRASGPVQVQVTISETGRVIEAAVLSGHPTLREAAREAARQWVFSPTRLSNVPVKVQGILTFNFTLE